MHVESVLIETLALDKVNARKHGDRNLAQIKASLERFGQQKPIVVDTGNVVRAGNGTLAAARALGWKTINIVRTALQGSDATAYGIADNRTAELAEWDNDVLATLLSDPGLGDVGFDEDEIKALGGPVEVVEDELPTEVPDRCARGDLWRLGQHRLLCGDSINAEDVARLLGGAKPFLMVTDPPYGVEYDPEWREAAAEKGLIGFGAKRMGKVQNDERADWKEAWSLFPGKVVYVWHASTHSVDVGSDLQNCGFQIRSSVIWRKPSFAISRGHYHWQHEPCWYAVKKGATAKWAGDRSQSTVWDVQTINMSGAKPDDAQTDHGTQKPVECMARPIRNHGGAKDDVYDPFLGSGTTIIAAEQLGRRCFGLEISPGYCDVILARWEQFTGKAAEKVEQ